VVKWLPKYKKDYIFGDSIAALTVGIIRVPQGMAYALLAGVPPIYGLYSCFFPVLLWFLFSTSKHTSVGTNAVICLMLQNLAAKQISAPVYFSNATTALTIDGQPATMETVPEQYWLTDDDGNSMLNKTAEPEIMRFLDGQFEMNKVQVVLSASLIVGFVQLIMAVCRLGFLTTLMPDPVIQGFTTGAAFHVVISQAKYIFGLSKYIPRHSGPLDLFFTCGDIIKNLAKTNLTDLIISIICIPTMLCFKYLSTRYKKKLNNIPIPIELFLIIITTIASYFGHWEKAPFNVNIVDYIPTGFQVATVPQYLHLGMDMLSDCIIMALISVAVSLSLTKIYADKNEYDTDANQEIFALGICNTISTFVGSFAVAASLSRTAIQESAGGRTQLVSVLSSFLMLVVLLYLGPFFQPVPKSVLACIIIVALKSFFLQFGNLPRLWTICRSDFIIWIVTCMSVVLLGVDIGLFAGIAFSIAVLLYRLQHPKHGLLGRIISTDLYANMKKYPDAIELSNIKIFHFSDSVSYTNKDAFRKKLYDAVGCNPSKLLAKQDNIITNAVEQGIEMPEIASLVGGSENNKIRNRSSLKMLQEDVKSVAGFSYLVLDATMWSFVDSTAAREIVQVTSRFSKLNVTLMLAGVSQTVLKILDKCGLFEENLMKRENVFVTLHDAVITAEKLVNGGGSDDSDSYASRPGYPGFDALLL